MAAQFDRADGDGLLRHSGAEDSQTMHSDEGTVCFQEDTLSEEQEEMYGEYSSEVQRGVAVWCAASLGKSL